MPPWLVASLIVLAPLQPPQDSCSGPWRVGESLQYRVSLEPFGRVGRAAFRVLPPDSLGVDGGVVFASDFRASVLFMGADNTYRSWYDPENGRTLAYVADKRELGRSYQQDVLIDDQGRWRDAATGEEGEALHDAPLDELAFLYVVRQLPLDDGDELALHRHFRDADNPVRVTVRGREKLRVYDGHVPVIQLEVQPQRLSGGGRMILFLADDATRRPVRMNVDVPLAGHLQLNLESEQSRFGCRTMED